MTLFNNYMGTVRHTIKRKPTSEAELEYIKTLFPDTTVHRKNPVKIGYVTLFSDIKLKNWHWYK